VTARTGAQCVAASVRRTTFRIAGSSVTTMSRRASARVKGRRRGHGAPDVAGNGRAVVAWLPTTNLTRHERAEGACESVHDDQEGAHEPLEARAERLDDRDGGLQCAFPGQGETRVVEVPLQLERNRDLVLLVFQPVEKDAPRRGRNRTDRVSTRLELEPSPASISSRCKSCRSDLPRRARRVRSPRAAAMRADSISAGVRLRTASPLRCAKHHANDMKRPPRGHLPCCDRGGARAVRAVQRSEFSQSQINRGFKPKELVNGASELS
jgi:hypothetical protein